VKNALDVDYLQNIEGKTLAWAYSARAFAGASTPVTWKKVDEASIAATSRSRPCPSGWRRSTILWKPVLTGKPANLRRMEKYLRRT
jgi:DNA primase